MKQYNKILEAINKGIQIALDDFDDMSNNKSIFQYNDVINSNHSEYIRFNNIITKLLNDDPSLPRKMDQIIAYKEMIQLYNEYNFHYKAHTLDELKTIVNKFIEIWQTTTKNFNWIDVSSLDSLKYLFSGKNRDKFGKVEIDKWNVSNVKDMSFMAWKCQYFEADLSEWDVHNVETIAGSFIGCKKFNSDLSNWNVWNLKDGNSAFLYCESFNSDLSQWNTSKLVESSQMFKDCKNFNSDLSNWDMKNVQSTNSMFYGCEKFEQDLSKWNLDKCNNINQGQWFREMFVGTPMEKKYDLQPIKVRKHK